MNKKILLVGGGGHCKSVLDTLLEKNDYAEIGIIEKDDFISNSIMGVPILGCDDDLPNFYLRGYEFAFLTVGNLFLRIKLFNILSEIGYKIPIIIDSSAKVSKNANIEKGVFIGKNCVVNAGVEIKRGAIINSGAIVEHDCYIGEFSHIAPGAVLCGEVSIGNNSHLGANSCVKQQVRIGSNSIIGMGSVVIKNIHDSVLAYGSPCKEVKKV